MPIQEYQPENFNNKNPENKESSILKSLKELAEKVKRITEIFFKDYKQPIVNTEQIVRSTEITEAKATLSFLEDPQVLVVGDFFGVNYEDNFQSVTRLIEAISTLKNTGRVENREMVDLCKRLEFIIEEIVMVRQEELEKRYSEICKQHIGINEISDVLRLRKDFQKVFDFINNFSSSLVTDKIIKLQNKLSTELVLINNIIDSYKGEAEYFGDDNMVSF